MVHRHPTLYRILGLIFLAIAIVLAFLGGVPPWSATARFALVIFSLFSLILTLSYFHLGMQEEQGF